MTRAFVRLMLTITLALTTAPLVHAQEGISMLVGWYLLL